MTCLSTTHSAGTMHAKEGERRDKGGATKDERGPLHVERDNLPRMQMQFLARAPSLTIGNISGVRNERQSICK